MGGLAHPLWTHLTFVQNFVWIGTGVKDGIPAGITWTLAIEEQFYLLLPLLVRFLPASKLPRILLMLALIAPFWRIGMAIAAPSAALLLVPSRFDALCGGAFLAAARRQSGRTLLMPGSPGLASGQSCGPTDLASAILGWPA